MAQKGYTTEVHIENYMLKEIDPSFATVINDWIEGVENTIDLITGRNFKADTDATARLFDGDDDIKLIIDDCVEITLVERGTDDYGGAFETIPATGSERYFSHPANHTAIKKPITSLSLRADRWTLGTQNHRITAKWGYSIEVPADIRRVATVLVAGIINAHSPSGQEIKSERIGNYQVTYNSEKGNNSLADFEEAKLMLDSYKRYFL